MNPMRPATLADLPALARSLRQTFNAPPWNDQWRDDAHSASYLEGLLANPATRAWVVFEGRELAGALIGHRREWWSGAEFFVDECWVDPQWQGNGLGRLLVDGAQAELAQGGVALMSLLTMRQLPAARFYRHLGFSPQADCHLFWRQSAGGDQ